MEQTKILSSSLLDILFDGRNKVYGAYELRATYPKRLLKALLATGVLLGLAVSVALIKPEEKKIAARPIISPDLTIEKIEEPKKVEPPPPTLPKQMEPKKLRRRYL